MGNYRKIYRHHAGEYEELVAREDYEGNLPRTLAAIRPLAGCDVVDFGAGTARVTRLLMPHVRHVWAFDLSTAMLSEGRARCRETGLHNWSMAAGENGQMPVRGQVADLAIEGWSFGHLTGWYPDSWREKAAQALSEMRRVLRPGGTMVIIETMGTGRETPEPPSAALAEFYAWLEADHGFNATWVRTDYRFKSIAEAERLIRFFGWDDLADQVVRELMTVVPECTGIWHRGV